MTLKSMMQDASRVEKSATKKAARFQKMTKETVRYRRGSASKECGQCTMFRRDGLCTLVKGEISPTSVCDYFKRNDTRWRIKD